MATDHCWPLEKAMSLRQVWQCQSNHKGESIARDWVSSFLGRATLSGFAGKNLPTMQKAQETSLISGWGDPGGVHDSLSSILTWRIQGQRISADCSPCDNNISWARKFQWDHGCKQCGQFTPECSDQLCLMQKLQSSYMLNLESTFHNKLLFITWLPCGPYLQEENHEVRAFRFPQDSGLQHLLALLAVLEHG